MQLGKYYLDIWNLLYIYIICSQYFIFKERKMLPTLRVKVYLGEIKNLNKNVEYYTDLNFH